MQPNWHRNESSNACVQFKGAIHFERNYEGDEQLKQLDLPFFFFHF